MSIDNNLVNPKSTGPAIYIPGWLTQVPIKELSFGAKMLYGRLAQWSNTKGQVHRSASQLAEELGCSTNTIDKLKLQLKEVKLIRSFQAEKGGVNYFEFLNHEFMHRELTDCLEKDGAPKNKKKKNPTPKQGYPIPPNEGTPYPRSYEPKVKEVKESKNNPSNSPSGSSESVEEEELKEEKKRRKTAPRKATTEQCKEFFSIWNEIMGNDLSKINASITKARPIVTWWLKLGDSKTKFKDYLENIYKYYKGWAFNTWGDGQKNNFFSICRGANVEQVSDGIIKSDAEKQLNKPIGKQ